MLKQRVITALILLAVLIPIALLVLLIGLGFGLYCYLSAREPFILGELREERRARESAAAAPCPAFTVGPPVFRPHPPPTALLSADKMVSE